MTSQSLRSLAPVLGLSVASLFGYRSGSIKISPKAWSKLEQAERAAGLSPAPPSTSSAPLSAASAPLRFDLSSADPGVIEQLRRVADALEAVQRGTAKSEGMLGKIVAAQERIAAALEELAKNQRKE